MAKNLIVTITGYAGEIKQGKAGAYVVLFCRLQDSRNTFDKVLQLRL